MPDITIETAKTVLDQNPDLKTAVLSSLEPEIPNYLTGKGFKIRTQADEDNFLNTYKTQVLETEMPNRVKEIHDRYDEDLFNLTGERKGPNEKTYDFLKRKVEEIKTSKVTDPVLKEQLTTLQTQLLTKETDFKKQLEAVEQQYFSREINMMVSSALENVNIALPAHLKTDEEKQRYISLQKNMIKTDLLNSLTPKKDNDGNVVFYEGDKPKTSTTDGKALGVTDIIKERYGYYLTKEDQRNLGGGGTDGKGGQGGVFSTKEEIIAHLESQGIKKGTTQFYAQYEKLCQESGLLKK